MNLKVSKDIESLSHYFADWLVNYINEVLSKQDRFTIALAGGNTPRKLYQLLASDDYREKVDWERMHFFWGDERYVSITDDRSNAKMAYESLLNHIPLHKEHVYPMQTDGQPDESAKSYEKILRSYFQQGSGTFDLVLLGLGDNGHTLSLFPGYKVVRENKNWVCSFYLKEENIYRITLTAPVVNQASQVAFLVSGGDKAAAVYHVLAGEHDPDLYPAQIIQPFNSQLYWFCDEAAAADL
jgi:6-phosphogluconolactonase